MPQKKKNILNITISCAVILTFAAFILYIIFKRGPSEFYLHPGIFLTVVGLIGLFSAIVNSTINPKQWLFQRIKIPRFFEMTQKTLDYFMQISVTLFSFYFGLLMLNMKDDADKKQHALVILRSVKIRDQDYINTTCYILPKLNDTLAVLVYTKSTGQRPFYLLDALPLDQALSNFSLTTFNVLTAAEEYDKKVREIINDSRYTMVSRKEAILLSGYLNIAMNNQIAEEQLLLLGKLDTAQLRLKAELRLEDTVRGFVATYYATFSSTFPAL